MEPEGETTLTYQELQISRLLIWLHHYGCTILHLISPFDPELLVIIINISIMAALNKCKVDEQTCFEEKMIFYIHV